MGIEPTNHNSHCGPTGFEGQARHQTGSTSPLADYTTHLEKTLMVRCAVEGSTARNLQTNLAGKPPPTLPLRKVML